MTNVRITSTPHLLAALPWIISYYVTEGAVVVGKQHGSEQLGAAVVPLEGVPSFVSPAGFDSVLTVVVYSDDPEKALEVAEAWSQPTIAAMSDGWHEVIGGEVGPAEPYADPATLNRIAAEFVGAGIAAPGFREDLRARVEPVEDGETVDQEALYARLDGADEADVREGLEEYLQAWLIDYNDALSVDDAAYLAAAVMFGFSRDVATTAINRSTASRFAALWTYVARRTAGPAAHCPLALAALSSYMSGNGAVANMALDRLESEGGGAHPLGGLVREIIVAGLHPTQVEEALRDASE